MTCTLEGTWKMPFSSRVAVTTVGCNFSVLAAGLLETAAKATDGAARDRAMARMAIAEGRNMGNSPYKLKN